ncbi:putative leucine-rich repeat-containing protein DDB_G0290503 isoform X2 [Girardinichthys multiradiatus]|uniref:putative leucine-rich repeat-containing protein DDB_G0290503 isoform X2 n=1 Tax=Girardinichthys multiradiatus TaxID=208333 RepID=UPI001FADB8D5|nr:putative leucine-rich repeat-containing protein DDB_G0290503 isoform X2 [Girardinichthys multiradiatus]
MHLTTDTCHIMRVNLSRRQETQRWKKTCPGFQVLNEFLFGLFNPMGFILFQSINKLCTGVEERLASLNMQLQETTKRNSQLDGEAFKMRRDVRQLNLKLSTCTSALTSVAGSYQAQLQTKMDHLLEVLDTEIFQVLKLMGLTRDVRALQRKFESAVNSNGNSTEITALQVELNAKTTELNAKKQKINRTGESLALILEIISLQNQIWDLQDTKLNIETALNVDGKLLALQELLDKKLNMLQRKDDILSIVLEQISVRSQIIVMEKRIKILTEETVSKTSNAQRQLRQKTEQLKRAILLLRDRENDQNLTKEIIRLQMEVALLSQLVSDTERTLEPILKALTVSLEVKQKEEAILQKKLESADHGIAQLIMKIISIMEELREQQETKGGQHQDILSLLQTYKQDYTKAQTEIKNLKDQLGRTREQCSGVEERYIAVKTELEQRIAQLNKTEASEPALILTVINLHGEINALKKLISTTTDTNEIAKLQKLIQQKQEVLNTRTADIERLIPNPSIILRIIELQNKIWELQSNYTDGTTDVITVLQQRLQGLLSELDSKDQDSTIQTITILNLQSQVEYLQKLLSMAKFSHSHRITQLTNELEAKQAELGKVFREVTEKNQTNGNLLISISLLQSKLRQLETAKESEEKTASATVTKLKEQLKIKEKENQEHQALIKTLQISLNHTEAQCSLHEHKIKDLQNNLDTKIEKLNSKHDMVTSLVLKVSTLAVQLEELRKQLKNSLSQSKVEELQRIIDQKNADLDNKTVELREQSTQAQRFLQIIAVQVEIEQLAHVASNESDYVEVRALQDHLNYLIDGIQDTDNKNTKLTLKILAQQDEIAKLKKEEENRLGEQAEKIKDLENELELVRTQIKEKTILLESSTTGIANLSAQIMELRDKTGPLQEQISDLKQMYAENLEELQERLNFTRSKLQNTELQLKHADAENFKLIMEITNLRAKVKKTMEEASKTLTKSTSDLEQQLKTNEKENRKLESVNRDLRQQIDNLEMCCNANSECEDEQKQLLQSQEDADRLQQLLLERDAALKKLQRDFEQQRQEKDRLQDDYDNLVRKQTDVEDRTIYSTKTTWDPLTAHPRLTLSANNTEVFTAKDPVQVKDNPSRFDVVLGVLGATGYSRGRHYWEVSVAEKNCYHIGMTSESVKRKGLLSFRPANGFWTLVLTRYGELKAIDRMSVNLQVERQPITLGILLDYKKGQISFYDSGARSHLYSFSAQEFTDKIYPFLNYCVEDVEHPQPIVLLPPGSTDWIN